MNAITNVALPLLGSGLVGACSGGLVARVLCHRLHDQHQQLDSFGTLDPAAEASIRDAASRYAARAGHPEAAGLIADKLRLGAQIRQRRLR